MYKKTQTLGDILLKKDRRVEKEYKKKTLCTGSHAQSALRHMWANLLEPSRKEIKNMKIFTKSNTKEVTPIHKKE